MLKFIQQKANIPQQFPSYFKEEDTMPYMQYIHKHIKEVWYGLMVADLMQPPLKAVDDFIKKWGDKAFNAYHRSVEIGKVSIFKDDKEGKYVPMKVTKIGYLYL